MSRPIVLALTCGVALAVTVAAAQAQKRSLELPITIQGCVVAGEKANTYVIKNTTLVPGPGSEIVHPDAFYRLDSTKGLKAHVGHLVQISGIADFDDVDKGTVKRKVQDGEAIIEMSSERRPVQIKESEALPPVPVGTSGKADIVTYKLKVSSIRMVSSTCS